MSSTQSAAPSSAMSSMRERAGEFVAQGVDAGADVFVLLGPGAFHGGGDGAHFGLGGLQGHAAAEFGEDAEVVVGAVGEIVFAKACGDPDLGVAGGEVEIGAA